MGKRNSLNFEGSNKSRSPYVFATDPETNKSLNIIILSIEGRQIKIERQANGRIVVSLNNGEVLAEIIKKDSAKKNMVSVFGHELKIQYVEVPSIFGIIYWNAGFNITVDNRPVEKTAGDPEHVLKLTARAFYLYAAISFFTIIYSVYLLEIPFSLSIFLLPIVVAIIFITFGIIINVSPVLFSLVGSIFGCIEILFFFKQSIESNYVSENKYFFAFFLFLRIGAIIALMQGIFAGIKQKRLRKGF
jgi:hypothetical protein